MQIASLFPGFWGPILSNPFGGGFQDPTNASNPYAATGSAQPFSQPPPKRSNVILWVVLGVVGTAVAASCCCGGGMYFSVGVLSNEVKNQLAQDPVIQQHLGDVKSVSVNIMAAAEDKQKNNRGGNVLAFDVQGSKASGVVVGLQDPQARPGHFLINARLKVNGNEFPLSP